jgi:hypothetical protein
MEAEWLSAWSNLGAAVGTVAALTVALAVLRLEQKERARAEIRSVRSWLDFEEPQWVVERRQSEPNFNYRSWVRQQPSDQNVAEMRRLVANVENASDEMIYDVRLRFALGEDDLLPGEMRSDLRRLKPGEITTPMMEPEVPLFRLWSLKAPSGIDVIFTDGRGRRWNRDPFGRLVLLRPLRWWAPWRVPHRLELDDFSPLPWWAWRSHWVYRWQTIQWRSADGWPPPLWAVDARWKRMRWVRANEPVPGLRWATWKEREKWAHARVRRGVPPPWWAVDKRWSYWRWYRGEVRDARRARRRDGAPKARP